MTKTLTAAWLSVGSKCKHDTKEWTFYKLLIIGLGARTRRKPSRIRYAQGDIIIKKTYNILKNNECKRNQRVIYQK